MQFVRLDVLTARGPFAASPEWSAALAEVQLAVQGNVWPPGNPSGLFEVYPQVGKLRGMGNGVVPIKVGVLAGLQAQGWTPEGAGRQLPGDFDAVKGIADGQFIGLEWETGNISSSHRAINRMIRGYQEGWLKGGILVLPTQRLARYLTDRVGTYEELMRYRSVWVDDPRWTDGALAVVAVEQDADNLDVLPIPKMTAGRALG